VCSVSAVIEKDAGAFEISQERCDAERRDAGNAEVLERVEVVSAIDELGHATAVGEGYARPRRTEVVPSGREA
jgi:hypothetical protein